MNAAVVAEVYLLASLVYNKRSTVWGMSLICLLVDYQKPGRRLHTAERAIFVQWLCIQDQVCVQEPVQTSDILPVLLCNSVSVPDVQDRAMPWQKFAAVDAEWWQGGLEHTNRAGQGRVRGRGDIPLSV